MAHHNFHDHKKECYNRGRNAENLFADLALERGYALQKSSSNEERFDHFDYKMSKDGKEVRVEVKARKKTGRKDASPQDTWIWVEFRNVAGKEGWLYGKADFIAFEQQDRFILVNRAKLAELSEKLVDTDDVVVSSANAKYRGYRRKNRPKELTGMIKMSDILKLKHKNWLKELD